MLQLFKEVIALIGTVVVGLVVIGVGFGAL
jgi:hypothetical protein